jgi:hypothetical protein
MQKTTLILVSMATLANGGLWLWARPNSLAPTHGLACPVGLRADADASEGLDSASALPELRKVQPQWTRVRPEKEIGKTAASTNSLVPAPDQAWLSSARDGVLQVAQSAQFFDKLTIADVQCQGSMCEVTGSTQASSDGQRHGATEVARLMNAMTDGQIAGGDTGRAVLMTSVQTDTQSGQATFALQIQPTEGPPSNPCQAVLDQWNTLHPGDFSVSTPGFFTTNSISTTNVSPPPPGSRK